jgi:hypothetical protein
MGATNFRKRQADCLPSHNPSIRTDSDIADGSDSLLDQPADAARGKRGHGTEGTHVRQYDPPGLTMVAAVMLLSY